jgi:RNase P/RNase MRP subunit p29
MRQSIGRLILALVAGAAVATVTFAQETTAPITRQVSGEVLKVEGYTLAVKLIPSGEIRTFTAVAGRTATVDGKVVTLDKVVPGTVLTATVTWTPTPGTVTTISGEVVYVSMNTVLVRLSDGTVKQYTAKSDFEFMLNGRKATVSDLRVGTKLTAVKLTEDPATKITLDTPITGKSRT